MGTVRGAVTVGDAPAPPSTNNPEPGVPAQVHETVGDPFRDEGWAAQMATELAASGASCEVFEYPGDGHLFTDASLPKEYDAASTELLWSRVLPFLA